MKLTNERISTGVSPYAVDVSSDGRWAVIGNTGIGGRIIDDADVVTLVDVSRRPFRAVQQISVPSSPEGVAISPDGRWIIVQSMAGTNLLATDPGRQKIGKLVLYEIKDGSATKVNEIPGAEAAQGVVFSQDGKQVLLQMNVERALGVYSIRDLGPGAAMALNDDGDVVFENFVLLPAGRGNGLTPFPNGILRWRNGTGVLR